MVWCVMVVGCVREYEEVLIKAVDRPRVPLVEHWDSLDRALAAANACIRKVGTYIHEGGQDDKAIPPLPHPNPYIMIILTIRGSPSLTYRHMSCAVLLGAGAGPDS